jgi:hypothetical protein
MCVTAADLGRPITAIVHRCGAPELVMSLGMSHELLYIDIDAGRIATVYFDADQTRVRILQFFAMPPGTPEPVGDWNIALPFQSGEHDIHLGTMTLADAQNALAADTDVTTAAGAAFRSTPENDIVLDCSKDSVVRAAYIGERAALVQLGMIASPLGEAPLRYIQVVPRDAWLKSEGTTGAQSTIFRVDVDAAGIVRNVVIVIPSSDAVFDASTQAKIGDARFRPATLEARAVPGSCFVQVRH